MSAIAKDARVGRESLYKALSGDGNPEFSTIVRVLSALRLSLSVMSQAEMAPSGHDDGRHNHAPVAAARSSKKVQVSRRTSRSKLRPLEHVSA